MVPWLGNMSTGHWLGVAGIPPTFQDDFSGADLWVETGTKNQVNISTNVLDYDFDRDTTNHKTVHDLISTSDTEWILRWKFDIVNLVGATPGAAGYIGMISTDNTIGATGTNDFIGIDFTFTSAFKTPRLRAVDGGNLASGTEYTFAADSIAGVQYWELKRLADDTIIANVYSDAEFTILIESSGNQTIATSIIGLQYIGVITDNNGTSSATFDGAIDDVKFWDGISEL